MTKRWTDKSGFQFEAAAEGETNTWLTPPELVKRLGKFDLDPCAAVGQPWKLAKKSYTEKDDGLAQPWKGRVFCNPPYGPNTKHWLKKCSDHGNCIALVFARVETIGFFVAWDTATALLFLPGRLSFYTIKGELSKGKPAANVLIAWGDNNRLALLESGLAGAFIDTASVLPGIRIN